MSSWTPKPGNGLPSREPCSCCGKTGDKWMKRSWCAACYQRWDNNGRPESGPPRIYRPRGDSDGICPVCGTDGQWITTNGWCMKCQARWRRAGSPESGPPPGGRTGLPPEPAVERPRDLRDAGPSEGGPCSACGKSAATWTDTGLCDPCDTRLANALRDYSGRPTWGKPPGVCPICGWIGRLRGQEDWCPACHARWRKAGYPGDKPAPPVRTQKKPRSEGPAARKVVDLDKLTRLRVMWALARPGEENPYECIAPGCHETADPSRRHHCAMHEQRFRLSGTYDTHQCANCGSDFKRYGGYRMLCDRCRETWGYCGGALHEGERLVPREHMVKADTNTGCKACSNRRQRDKRRRQGIPSREEWAKARRDRSRRAIVAGLAASVEPGTLIPFEVLADALELDSSQQRRQIHEAVAAARRAGMPDRTLVTVQGEGYRVMRAALQPRVYALTFSRFSGPITGSAAG